ncbi:MAG: type VI secretion system contractile sheath large subunit [Deltaproteobacteria bacterium]|nr:type VI secretion system contractile sheath large subunit [Deltaproteobacteria bacterium]
MSDDDKGGFVIGGIGFGSGAGKPIAEVVKTAAASPSGGARPLVVDGLILPLRVLVLADLIARPEWNASIHAPEHPIAVAGADVDALFARLQPKLALEVESVLHEGTRTRIDIAFTAMQSFRPDALCQSVPLLRSLLDGKQVLERLRDGSISVEGAASELARLWHGSPLGARVLGGVEVGPRHAPSAPIVSAPADHAADRILGMLDLDVGPDLAGETPPSTPAPTTSPARTGGGRFDGFLAAIANSGKGRPGARPDEGIRAIEKALGVQLAAIVQHPEFRRLEESWRGLAFLVGRTPKTGVRLDVLSCRIEEAPAALRRVTEGARGAEPPVTFAVVDGAVTSDASSLAWFRSLAEAAESAALVAITNAAPALFGVALDEVDRLDNKQALFDAPARAPWRAEANRPAALWVTLGLNRLLARTAYDTRSSRVREALVAETVSGTEGEVWIQPAWALGALAIRSHQRFEWPAGVTGARDGGLVENLPVREIATRGGERVAVPTEAFLSTETQRALARLGLTALAAQPNSDAAYLMTAATAYVPPPKRTYDDSTAEPEERLPQATLTDQLFVARLAQQLEWLGEVGARDGGEPRRVLEAGLGEMFRNAPPSGPEIELQLGDDVASVTVRPRRFLGVGLEELTLRVPLR